LKRQVEDDEKAAAAPTEEEWAVDANERKDRGDASDESSWMDKIMNEDDGVNIGGNNNQRDVTVAGTPAGTSDGEENGIQKGRTDNTDDADGWDASTTVKEMATAASEGHRPTPPGEIDHNAAIDAIAPLNDSTETPAPHPQRQSAMVSVGSVPGAFPSARRPISTPP